MFRSLSGFNYRQWFAGALVSNVGTWMQRTSQDWVVLTELTKHDAAAVGITSALQLGPILLLAPWSGLIADRFDKRKLLIATQLAMAALGLGLGLIVLIGVAQLWHVYAFALALGIVAAVDAPARQSFVSELVDEKDLSNAVALNSASFNIARLLGPATAGMLTVAVGAGWVFVINGASYAATLFALARLRTTELHRSTRAARTRGQLLEGFRYVYRRPNILVVMAVVFILGTFGLNFAIFLSTMASVVFHHSAAEYGLLSSIFAVGSVLGALLSARRERPRIGLVFVGAGAFGLTCAVAAIMPTFWAFAAVLVLVGFSSLTTLTTANGVVQTSVEPHMRGRVMALYMAIFAGGTPLGAPLVGWVANTFGPRWAMGVGALAGIAGAIIGVVWLLASKRVALRGPRRRTRAEVAEEFVAEETMLKRT